MSSVGQNTKLWIGNFDTKTAEYQLLKLVEPFGKIVKFDFVYGLKGSSTERVPKGFAFVTYQEASQATKAMKHLNKVKLNGRTLIVKEARPEKSLEAWKSSKKSLEESRKEMIKTTDKTEQIKALEAKLKMMQEGSNEPTFKLAIPTTSSKRKS